MIITIRGANGSGKSTVVRAVLAQRDMKEFLPLTERCSVPLGYVDKDLFVAGHYRHTMGGFDTVRVPLVEAYRVLEKWSKTHHVLFEGKALANDVSFLSALTTRTKVTALFLDTTLEDCIASVRGRERANKIQRSHIERLYHKSVREKSALCATRVNVVTVSRAEALPLVNQLMKEGD